MTSYKQIFETNVPLINLSAWEPAQLKFPRELLMQQSLDEVGMEVIELRLSLPGLLPPTGEKCLLAVDPGYAHTGLAYVTAQEVVLYQADVRAGKQYTKPSTSEIVRRILLLDEALPIDTAFTVIEDAAYSKSGSPQASLGLVRGVWAGLATERYGTAQFVGPQQAKKLLFGTAKGVDYHKQSKHYPDATAAFALALVGCMLLEEGNV